MLAEVSAGLGSLKAMKDIVQGLNAAKTEAAINGVKIELQGLILDAQQGLFAAQEAQSAEARRIADLEEKIARFEDWETEKKRYQLKAIDTGAFAYMHKPGMENGEPAVWLCQTCFEKRHKSPLQYRERLPQGSAKLGTHNKWACNLCKGEVAVYYGRKPHIAWEPKEGE